MNANSIFWEERYNQPDFVYGIRPNAFVKAQERRVPRSTEVLELGGGEGRNAVWLARQGHRATMVDYAAAGLQKAERLAREQHVHIDTIQADVLTWSPDRRWEAVMVAFLHLSPDTRPALYELMQEVLRPGGIVIAEWFRPEQVLQDYASGGPPSAEMMVTAGELAANFAPVGVDVLEETETTLDEGAYHQGTAAVVRLVWRKPGS